MRNRLSVLVMVLILAVIAGICFPLVVHVRHLSSVSKCKNNLHQIAKGLYNYDSANGFFPSAGMKSEVVPPEQRVSWMIELDPHVHARMDPDWNPVRDKPWDSEENLHLARKGRMPWYLCPASQTTPPGEMQVTHYVGCAGLGANAANLPITDRAAGFFGYERTIKQADITDGLENTLMVIETARDNGPWMAAVSTVRGVIGSEQPYLGVSRPFGGMHRRATVVLFADGSVHSISDSIDARTLEALATIAASDSIGQFDRD